MFGKRPAKVGPAPNAHGSLDAPANGKVNGWACDPDQPDVRMLVEISIDGQPFQSVVAGEYRSDLLQAGIGDGFQAFSVTLPEGLFDGAPHKVEARIAGAEKGLQHSPRTIVFTRLPEAPSNSSRPNISIAEGPHHPRTLPDSVLQGLSVVIATKDNGVQLERTLRACAPAARNLPVEFIVVEYGSADDTVARLKSLESQIPNLRWVSITTRTPGEARNKGVALASRELILFLSDTVAPAVATFFEQHMNAHRMLPGKNVAALGKVVWPNLPDERVSFLMAHLQGAGEQQFGFHSLLPYTWLDWRFFSAENVSFKRSIAADWAKEGYRANLPGQLLEDTEFAYRLNNTLEGGFSILYCPAASVSHEASCTVRQFIERQMAAGLSARSLFEQHEGAMEKLGIEKLERLLAAKETRATGSADDLLRMIEGAKSWGVVIESTYKLGSQNWHADLLNAIFELSFLQGYVTGCPDRDANYAAAYRYCIERFQEKLSTAAAFEVFGRFPSFTLT